MGSAVKPFGVGIVGVGKISEQYLASFPALPGLRLIAVSDLDEVRAAEVAAGASVASYPVDELIGRPDIDVVLNLTIPAAHAEVATKALLAGKHVYGEKPLALSPADAAPFMVLASEHGLRIGSAPDTVLGTGIQTARQLLDSGAVGEPVAAACFWAAPGHELWHPAPGFYYQPGAGPFFDMGPYYVTALVTLLGPIVRVAGLANRSARERSIATGTMAGTAIAVGVDTHVSALLEHENGVTSTVTTSFEVWGSRHPMFEVYGTSGTLGVPDPNEFSNSVELITSSDREWRTIDESAGYAGAGRGFGLADMAHAIATNRPHRASGELAFHVLEVMDAVLRSSAEHSVIEIGSTVARPEAVPKGATPSSW